MTTLIPAWVDGTLTPVEKLEAHVKGLRHKAVSVFVLHGDAVLMQRRAMGKYHTPGLWANTCCTHPDWDETSLDCAHRRLNEELGITGLSPELRHNLEYRAEVGGGLIEHEVVDVFVCDIAQELVVTPNPDEVMATEWVRFSDLVTRVAVQPSHYTPWVQIYLRDHARTIFGAEMAGSAPA
ncbi:MAG: isopentenyl-diphosphate Delta-isomerase [Sulfitobacter sp.]